MFGGVSNKIFRNPTLYDDTWIFDPSNNEWQMVDYDAAAPSKRHHMLFCLSVDRKFLYVWGGLRYPYGAESQPFDAKIYRLSVNRRVVRWENFGYSGIAPAEGGQCMIMYGNSMFIYNAIVPHTKMGAIAQWDLGSKMWDWHRIELAPDQGMVFQLTDHVFVVIGTETICRFRMDKREWSWMRAENKYVKRLCLQRGGATVRVPEARQPYAYWILGGSSGHTIEFELYRVMVRKTRPRRTQLMEIGGRKAAGTPGSALSEVTPQEFKNEVGKRALSMRMRNKRLARDKKKLNLMEEKANKLQRELDIEKIRDEFVSEPSYSDPDFPDVFKMGAEPLTHELQMASVERWRRAELREEVRRDVLSQMTKKAQQEIDNVAAEETMWRAKWEESEAWRAGLWQEVVELECMVADIPRSENTP